jgi:hypothetical protein
MDNGGMFLFAALVPPREVLDDFWSVLTPSVEEVVSPEPKEIGRHARATRTRRSRRRQVAAVDAPPPPPPPLVDITPVPHVNLMLAKFGNLALNDAHRLVDSLGRAALEWPSPRLRLRGITPLDADGSPSIWVDIDGDLDALGDIARGVPRVAAGLSLFVDRRVFQPRVRLGSVNPAASAPQLEALLAELEQFDSNAWWQTGFALYTHADHGSGEPSFKTYADIPLGPHMQH